MPELPFPKTAKDAGQAVQQMQLLMDEIFEERIGGANIGDVFTIGDDDILSLQLYASGGLQNTSSSLGVKLVSTGGLQVGTTGISVKPAADGGLETDVDGLSVKLDGTSLTLSTSGIKVTDPLSLDEITLNTDGLHLK